MQLQVKNPPREFTVGMKQNINIKDCGFVNLTPDEQVTFKTEEGRELDIARKSWGYYGTPSINKRLRHFGFKTALVQNSLKHLYIMIVEQDKQEDFFTYLKDEKNELITWLDDLSEETIESLRS